MPVSRKKSFIAAASVQPVTKKSASRESTPSDCGDRLEVDMITDYFAVANDPGRLRRGRFDAKLAAFSGQADVTKAQKKPSVA